MAKATKDSSMGKNTRKEKPEQFDYRRRVDVFLGEIWHSEEAHREWADHTLKLIEEFLRDDAEKFEEFLKREVFYDRDIDEVLADKSRRKSKWE